MAPKTGPNREREARLGQWRPARRAVDGEEKLVAEDEADLDDVEDVDLGNEHDRDGLCRDRGAHVTAGRAGLAAFDGLFRMDETDEECQHKEYGEKGDIGISVALEGKH